MPDDTTTPDDAPAAQPPPRQRRRALAARGRQLRRRSDANLQVAPPRTLTAREACTRAGCKSMSTFYAWVRRAILPRALPGTHNYSTAAIDAALDRLAGIHSHAETLDPYQAWKHARKT